MTTETNKLSNAYKYTTPLSFNNTSSLRTLLHLPSPDHVMPIYYHLDTIKTDRKVASNKKYQANYDRGGYLQLNNFIVNFTK